jgi:hypothetical protein
LEKNHVHPDFKQLLLTGTVDDIINDAHKNMGIHEKKSPRLILTQMLDIVQDVYRRKTTRIQAARLLLNLFQVELEDFASEKANHHKKVNRGFRLLPSSFTI